MPIFSHISWPLPIYPPWNYHESFPFMSHDMEGFNLKCTIWDFPGGAAVKNPPANAEDTGSSPGQGRSHMPQSN